MCLVGAGTLALATPAIAGATVNQDAPQWEELGQYAYTPDQASHVTAVYTIQNVAEGSSEMLEDNGSAMNQGAVTDVWQPLLQGNNQPDDYYALPDDGPITQANYLWEFVPEHPGQYSSIVGGPGELINRQSGLCLDAVGTDPNYPGDGTAIDQWSCNGGNNQEWTAFETASGFALVSRANIETALGVGNASAALRVMATTCISGRTGPAIRVTSGRSRRRATTSPVTR
jgi:Ricin-type beta-trefoil lectin domain-like